VAEGSTDAVRGRATEGYDFVEDRTHDGRKFRMLNIVDGLTHECLAIRVGRKLKAADVIDVLSDPFILRGVPAHIRSDNGPEFVAKQVRQWITAVGAKTAHIEKGSPWENGHVESFNARLRDELLNGEVFYSLREAQVVIESWRAPQHSTPACLAGLQAARAGGDPASLRRLACDAAPTDPAHHANRGAQTDAALTFTTDHSVGAGQPCPTWVRSPQRFQPQNEGMDEPHSHSSTGSNSSGVLIEALDAVTTLGCPCSVARRLYLSSKKS
jgi:hypothetical protein